MYSVIYGVEIF